jgi:PAS domain S-box-containing protein
MEQDVATLKEMERRAKEASQMSRALLDAAPVVIIFYDENLNFIDGNDKCAELFGTTKEECLKNFFNYSPPYQNDGQKSSEKGAKLMRQALQEDKELVFDWMHRHSSGKLMPCEVTITRVMSGGKYIGMACIYNLTNVKETEKALAEANEMNRTLLDAAPVGMTLLDENLRIVDCNEEICRMLGTTKDYYLEHFFEFAPEHQSDGEKSIEKTTRMMKMLMTDGKAQTFDWLHRDSSGKIIPCEVTQKRIMQNGKYVCVGSAYDLRNLKEAEKALATANDLNKALLESVPVGLVIHDDNLKLVDCNNKLCEIFGADKETILNNYADFCPEFQPNGDNSAEKIIQIMQNALKGMYQVFEWEHRSSSGRSIPCEVTVTSVMIDGRYTGIACVYDLSNLKNAEKAIAEAEAFANVIAEASPLAFILFDEEWNVLDCNSTALHLFGCQDKQTLMDNYWVKLIPEYQNDGRKSEDKADQMREKALKDGRIIYENQQKTMSGETIPVESTLTTLVIENKKYLISFKYDLRNINRLTENIHAQSILLKTRLEQQEILSEMTKSLIGKDDIKKMIETALGKLGRYLRADRVVVASIDNESENVKREYMWFSSHAPRFNDNEAVPNHLVIDNFPEELSAISIAPVINSKMAGESTKETFRALADINVGGFLWSAIYVEGKLWGAISVEQCNKPREWTDSEQLFVSMTASTIASAIVRDIYYKRLDMALRQATAASKAKGEFLSNMSHEMRTPLNAIIGMTTIGRTAPTIERKNYSLDKIQDASTHLLGVINDVLDMSKIEANKLELSPVEFNFEKMLQRVVTVINFRMDEKRHNFIVNIDSKMPGFIIGDDQRLAQVITNLLSNAVKFTSDGGEIELKASMIGRVSEMCELRIEVRDSGIGISPEQQTHLFKAFGQADSGTSRTFGGTGLGLAISKRIVELMNGHIWVESELGKGAKFIFTVIMRCSEKPLEALLAAGINKNTIRILAVSEDQKTREYFSDIFKSLGMKCDIAQDGAEANYMTQTDYDIYFIDSDIHEIKCIELTQIIKSKNEKAVVVIIASVSEWAAMEDSASQVRVDKHLLKPLFTPMIIDCINENISAFHGETHDVLTESEFAGKHILLAEDIEINREIIMSLLEDSGLNIDCAKNGLEALEMVQAAPDKYDLIFMDMQMPQMDGLEATRQIRAIPSLASRKLPIIAMTANVFKEDIDQCIAAGMDDHIGKPINVEEVYNKLRNHIFHSS